MELSVNIETTQYMLGIPLGDPESAAELGLLQALRVSVEDGPAFSQVSVHPGEVEGLPRNGKVSTFLDLKDAQRVRQVIQRLYSRPIAIYEVRLRRLED